MILQSVPPLPDTPILERALFEQPWPLAAALGLIAVIACQQLLARAKAKAALGALGVGLALASGVVLLAGAVVTDRESIREASRDLVDAVVGVGSAQPGAPEHLRGRLDEWVLLTDIPGAPPEITRAVLITLIRDRLDGRNAIGDHRVRQIEATTDGPDVARSHVLVRATPASLGRPVNTSWRMHWQRSAPEGDWLLVELELLEMDGWLGR